MTRVSATTAACDGRESLLGSSLFAEIVRDRQHAARCRLEADLVDRAGAELRLLPR